MTVGDVFAGIGGLSLGLERAGFDVRWQIECDDYATAILERHWPHVPRRRDVRLADAATLEWVDCIAGGFPCTDISTAGRGAGLAGRQSGLWYEYARLVHTLRPRWVCIENVPALRTRGADVILRDLDTAGYTCWPVVVGARHVGAPHRRDRVFLLGRLADAQCHGLEGADAARATPAAAERGRRVLLAHGHDEGQGSERTAPRTAGALRDELDRCREWRRWPAGPGAAQHEWEAPRTLESRVGRATHGLSARLAGRRRRNALTALGNAVVPQVAELIGRAVLAVEREAACGT